MHVNISIATADFKEARESSQEGTVFLKLLQLQFKHVFSLPWLLTNLEKVSTRMEGKNSG